MTKLLISVTTVQEAQIAIENGADIVDLKNPADGALGALAIADVKSIVNYVNNTKLVSATIGNITLKTMQEVNAALLRIKALTDAKVDVIKIGFFDDDADAYPIVKSSNRVVLEALMVALKPMCLSKTVKFVAVLFAENHYHDDFIDALLKSGFDGVMIDTMHKNGKTYRAYNDDAHINQIANRVSATDAWFGVAGSLQTQDIAYAKQLNPSYIGFRGAACDGADRKNSLSAVKVTELRKFM